MNLHYPFDVSLIIILTMVGSMGVVRLNSRLRIFGPTFKENTFGPWRNPKSGSETSLSLLCRFLKEIRDLNDDELKRR